MNPLVINQGFLVVAMGELVLGATDLNDVSVRLFQNDIMPTPATALTDFTVATYTGYAAQLADPLGFPYDDVQGNVLQEFTQVLFQPTGTAISNVIYGWYAVGGAGTFSGVLLAAKRLDVPVTLASALDALPVSIRIAYNQPQGI